MPDGTEFEFHKNKKPGKTYVSPRLGGRIRIASKVIDSDETYHEAVLRDEAVLHQSPSGRHEIIAKFYEDLRTLQVVTIQKWNTLKGVPVGEQHFSFVGKDIDLLQAFLSRIVSLHFPDANKVNVQDNQLRVVVTTAEQAKALLAGNLSLIVQLVENEVTERDIVALAYRRKQLALFEELLTDSDFFGEHASGRKCERVWQDFFEANTWVFGYGLSYIFLEPLEGMGLRQPVRGFNVESRGKEADALMKTRAEVSSLCLVEIKRHDTSLLAQREYRPGVWPPSAELVAGISQAQETVRATVRTLSAPFRPKDRNGDPTGEELFGFEPRSYLVIGSLSEFSSERGTNEEKFRSFELFRRNVKQPEIITFDELLHRARFIVSTGASEAKPPLD
jgi:hypothetical protein